MLLAVATLLFDGENHDVDIVNPEANDDKRKRPRN
jgi:hypothetical protein